MYRTGTGTVVVVLVHVLDLAHVTHVPVPVVVPYEFLHGCVHVLLVYTSSVHGTTSTSSRIL